MAKAQLFRQHNIFLSDVDKKAHQKAKYARHRVYHLQYAKTHRLQCLLATIRHRCESPKHKSYQYYGARGIMNFLTLEDVRFLWNRDKADAMKHPTIDRVDGYGHYILSNCCFIERSDNLKKSWLGDQSARIEKRKATIRSKGVANG